MRNYQFAMLACSMIAAASCSDNNGENAVVESPRPIEVFGSIGSANTRVSGTSWSANDAIGISVKANSGIRNSNVQYVTVLGDGTFVPSVQSEAISLSASDGDVTMSAYYPYSASAGTTYDVSSWSEQSSPAIDLLYASRVCNSGTSAIMLQFYHKFTKMILNIDVVSAAVNPSNTLTQDSLVGMTITADGLNYPASVDLTTGTVSLGSADSQSLMVPINSAGTEASMIMAPGIRGTRRLTFNLANDRKLYWTLDDSFVMESGNAYRWNLNLSSTALEVEASIEGQIVDWNYVDMENLYITPETN